MTDLYKMKLGDILDKGNGDLVERVPGGWNYIYFNARHPCAVFVPMNSEFNRRTETA
jgi:hypothetical protein